MANPKPEMFEISFDSTFDPLHLGNNIMNVCLQHMPPSRSLNGVDISRRSWEAGSALEVNTVTARSSDHLIRSESSTTEVGVHVCKLYGPQSKKLGF